jgi:hypothetical protein
MLIVVQYALNSVPLGGYNSFVVPALGTQRAVEVMHMVAAWTAALTANGACQHLAV